MRLTRDTKAVTLPWHFTVEHQHKAVNSNLTLHQVWPLTYSGTAYVIRHAWAILKSATVCLVTAITGHQQKENTVLYECCLIVICYALALIGWGIMRWWSLSVCPSVCPMLTLSREWKGLGSWKLAGGKPWHGWPVTPIFRSKGRRSR